MTVSLRILTGFSFAHQVRCNLCVITLHIFNSDILFLSHFNKNVNTIRVYFPLMFGISVTVHSVHSNVAKIHSRLPAAMEFWLVCILSRYSLHFCQGFEKTGSVSGMAGCTDLLYFSKDRIIVGASTLARNKNYYKPQKCGLFYVKFYLFLCCTELYFIFICDIMRYETQL